MAWLSGMRQLLATGFFRECGQRGGVAGPGGLLQWSPSVPQCCRLCDAEQWPFWVRRKTSCSVEPEKFHLMNVMKLKTDV